ncbi:MAG: anti-sigma-factor antagonist [Blastococcus sp.]|nr:anti-sigma-factor antagonist [Blastococcus sp.]
MPLLNVTLVPAPDRVVVRLMGDADLSTAELIADALGQAAGLGARQIVVDAAGVRFWDCSGLHVLSRFTAEQEAGGRSCRIVGALPAARCLIEAADLGAGLVLDGPLPNGPAPARTAERVAVRTTGRRTTTPARRMASGRPVRSGAATAMAMTVRRRA